MKLVSIVGARPQFVKLAPVIRAIDEGHWRGDVQHVIIHTGQHYDKGLSDVFFEELAIPRPDHNLDVGSGTHGQQTGLMLQRIEDVLLGSAPEMVMVFGDTNSTLAGALAASKLHIPVAHVEAGLRSFRRQMPEEINRVVADHVSDLLLAPTALAMDNLRREGLGNRAILTGDLMYESVLLSLDVARRRSRILENLGVCRGEYGVVTLHRAENTDDPDRLHMILDGLNSVVAAELPLVFPVHPRTANKIRAVAPKWTAHAQLMMIDPVGYFDLLQLLDSARVVLTDSGGLQKEAFFVGCPCVTLRQETEWEETVEGGGNVVVGTQPERVLASVKMWRDHYPSGGADFSASVRRFFGGLGASSAILNALANFDRATT